MPVMASSVCAASEKNIFRPESGFGAVVWEGGAAGSAAGARRVIGGIACCREASAGGRVWGMRLLLVDGHYYAYRSFFAIRNLSNSRGEPTNAVFGFLKAMRRMMSDLSPGRVGVVWDQGLPLRRTEIQPEYKQQREEMPGDLVPQLEVIQRVLSLMGVASLWLPDTEADDLMACYALSALECGMDVVLATNDKDLFQLVRPGVSVYSTAKADVAGRDEGYALLGRDEVLAKWNVEPERILDVLALTGDSADNIPGVEGVGVKTAAKLVAQFGGVDAILSGVEGISNERLRGRIAGAADRIRQNREMVRLDLDLELPVPIDDLAPRPDYDALVVEIDRLEFQSLGRQIRDEATRARSGVQGELFG